MSAILGVGLTAFGRLRKNTLELMAEAASEAIEDAALERSEIDGLLCGYSTTMPHLMLSTLFAEYFGLRPRYAHGVQVGGATGCAMTMLAHHLVSAGVARNILVVGGDNRASGQSSDSAIQTLAQVGHADYELPMGPTVPAYYALLASRYLTETEATEEDLAQLAVLMRTHARNHPGAHFQDEISTADVLASKPVSRPLKRLDCCPISDGAAAVLIGRASRSETAVSIVGAGQRHEHQHVSALLDIFSTGAGASAADALRQARVGIDEIDYAAIYDSFTITLALLLEEIGISPRGRAGLDVADGRFGGTGGLGLNTHGGLLSYGHSGVAGGLAHIIETQLQMTGRAGPRQRFPAPRLALIHGDGGVLSSHVSLVLRAVS